VLPAGVATSTPSQISSDRRTTPSIEITIFAAWRLSRSSETSLIANASTLSPATVCAVMCRGWRRTREAWARRPVRSSSLYSFIRKPTVPQFMP